MSCGLIMFDEKNNVLLSKSKKGKYSFPKGKFEERDGTNYECARREFREETGISGMTYRTNRKEIKTINEKGKIIIYFACKIEQRFSWFNQSLHDPDNDITEAEFFSVNSILEMNNFSEERKQILLLALSCINQENLEYYDEI